MNRLSSFVCMVAMLLCAGMSYAMPSQAELDNVQPLVNELMGPLVKDFKAKKKLAVEVGDGAVELVAEANSDAAKFVLLKGAVSYYARAKAYDKAADTIESIMELVPDIPPKALYEITSKAAAGATVKNAPRLVALNKSAQKRAAVASRLASVKKQLRSTPADLKLIRQHAELLAAMGKWETALAEFAKLGGEIGKMATADADAMGEGTELADFWWNYTPTASEAKDAIRSHAASLYQKALDHGELDGLKRTLAERRIAEVAESNPQAVASKVEYKFDYKLDDKGNAILFGGPMPKPKGVLVIPDKIDGHTVTEIEGDCFRCEEVTRIVLPPHLEQLRGPTWNRVHTPGNKFGGCHNLESIEISPANQSFTSANGALYTKDKKRLIVYPKTRRSITLAKECNVIGESAFSDCKKFKTVKIPDSVTGIMTAAFLGCENMETVEFPKGVNDFGAYVFPMCPGLRKVVFHGDAPGHWVRRMRSGSLDTLFSHSTCDIVIEVEKGSKGWAGPGTTHLPERWPLDGNGSDSRPIRYITK